MPTLTAIQAHGQPERSAWRLYVRGFSAIENQLLAGVIALSRRRPPHLEIVDDGAASTADIVLVDGRDANAAIWAGGQPWLAEKAAVWVDTPEVAGRHIFVRRPVPWPTLPVLLERALDQHSKGSVSAVHISASRSVLIVDDSAMVRTLVRGLLEAEGLHVIEAASAEEGIQLAATKDFACVLLDVLMPGITGYEACRRIKNSKAHRVAPAILMLTSKSSPFDRIRGKMAGCDAYLPKPVSREELLQTLRIYMPALQRSTLAPGQQSTGLVSEPQPGQYSTVRNPLPSIN